MAVLQLKYWPAEVLTKVAKPVEAEEFNPELMKVLEDMAETMYMEQGIGLAAPQVGISKRIIVMDVPKGEDGDSCLHMIINPEIVEKEGTIVWEEGCLSFPTITADVTRASRVVLNYQLPNGEPAVLEADGLEAVCIQHEMDHLNGITFVEYLSPLKRKLLLRELKKYLDDQGLAAA